MDTFSLDWYSTETYFLAKIVVDIPLNLIMTVGFAAILSTKFDYKDDALPTLILVYSIALIGSRFLGYITAIVFGSHSLVVSMILASLMATFSGTLLSDRGMSDSVVKITSLLMYKWFTKHLMVWLYGFGRCPEDSISSVMYKNNLTDDEFDKSTIIMGCVVLLYFILSYFCLKIKVSWDSTQLISRKIKHLFQTK